MEKESEIEKATWTMEFINRLPDAAFAYIEPGGEKDDEGETKPRTLRHFPHHNMSVKRGTDDDSVDLPHLRNALARAPQSRFGPKALPHLIAHAKRLEVGEYEALLRELKIASFEELYEMIPEEHDKMLHKALSSSQKRIFCFPITKKYGGKKNLEGNEDPRIIEGYASTADLDRVGEIILPEAFEIGMEAYMQNPIVLFNHDFNRPIGKVTKYKIDSDGLWIKVEIAQGTRDSDEIWRLIQQGVLNAFSVATTHDIIGEIDDQGRNEINRWDLAEISVVTVPANEEALFRIGKRLKILGNKEMKKIMKDENKKDLFDTEEADEEIEEEKEQTENRKNLGKQTPDLFDIKAAVDLYMDKLRNEVNRRVKAELTPLEDDSREKVLMARIEGKLAERDIELARLRQEIAKLPADKRNMFPDNARITVRSKYASAGFKTLGDLQLLHQILTSHGNKPSDELLKAMDTATATEGSEFVATDVATDLWETIRMEARIAPTLRSIEMPTPTYTLPIESTLPEMFYVGESTAYNSSNFPEQSPATGSGTLTAKKFAIHCMYSGEFDEDSLVPVLPFIREQLGKSAAHGIDNVILNGDTETGATGNINSDDAAPTSTKNYLAMNGLRKLALVTNTANKSDDASIATLTAAGFNLLRGLMTNWGVNPAQLIIVLDEGTYFKTTTMSEVETVDQYGPQATILTGELAKIYGIPIVVSDEMGLTEADGKISATPANNTLGQICMYNRDGWMLGWRRRFKVETERIIATDQYRIVGTVRLALTNFNNEVSAVGYKITV